MIRGDMFGYCCAFIAGGVCCACFVAAAPSDKLISLSAHERGQELDARDDSGSAVVPTVDPLRLPAASGRAAQSFSQGLQSTIQGLREAGADAAGIIVIVKNDARGFSCGEIAHAMLKAGFSEQSVRYGLVSGGFSAREVGGVLNESIFSGTPDLREDLAAPSGATAALSSVSGGSAVIFLHPADILRAKRDGSENFSADAAGEQPSAARRGPPGVAGTNALAASASDMRAQGLSLKDIATALHEAGAGILTIYDVLIPLTTGSNDRVNSVRAVVAACSEQVQDPDVVAELVTDLKGAGLSAGEIRAVLRTGKPRPQAAATSAGRGAEAAALDYDSLVAEALIDNAFSAGEIVTAFAGGSPRDKGAEIPQAMVSVSSVLLSRGQSKEVIARVLSAVDFAPRQISGILSQAAARTQTAVVEKRSDAGTVAPTARAEAQAGISLQDQAAASLLLFQGKSVEEVRAFLMNQGLNPEQIEQILALAQEDANSGTLASDGRNDQPATVDGARGLFLAAAHIAGNTYAGSAATVPGGTESARAAAAAVTIDLGTIPSAKKIAGASESAAVTAAKKTPAPAAAAGVAMSKQTFSGGVQSTEQLQIADIRMKNFESADKNEASLKQRRKKNLELAVGLRLSDHSTIYLWAMIVLSLGAVAFALIPKRSRQ
ncbi:MAG: hypothetical protein NC924_04295 [Candidatus Omnitrophica bacterium]|nr:hypothetical protein [Candidatus Omnitrophota bacterium]